MKHTRQEILNVLQVIKDTCVEVGEDKDGCYKCPFAENGFCKLMDKEPFKWQLNYGNSFWRAFKC